MPLFGLQGAGIGAAVGFAVVALVRLRDIKRFITLKVAWVPLVTSLVLLIAMTMMQLVLADTGLFLYLSLAVSEFILIIINMHFLLRVKR